MTAVFDSYGTYYNLLYRDKDYRAETNYVVQTLKKFGGNVKSILEFGSGTGIHGRLLAQTGYQVTGVELSPQMVARASVIPGFSIQQGDIRQVRLNRTFDAAISLFHVMSYQVGNADILAALNSAAVHLKPGGVFIFDFWYSPAVYAQKPEERTKSLEDETVKITRLAKPRIFPNENRVDVHYQILVEEKASQQRHTIEEVHPMRHFSLPEIELLAEQTGFELIRAEEFLTGAEPGENTWGVCVVLRRQGS